MTITSNIHYNLTVWATGAKTLKQRQSNLGNVYEAQNAGTSAAPGPTHTSGTVADGGGVNWKFLSTYDYSSLDAWDAALPATLVDAVVALLWNNGEIVYPNGTQFVAKSTTTSTTNTYTIKCAPGESFTTNVNKATNPLRYNPAFGVAIKGAINYGDPLLKIIVDNCYIDGIQVNNQGGGIGLRIDTNSLGSISNCLAMTATGADNRVAGFRVAGSTGTTIYNCAVAHLSPVGTGIITVGPINVTNCTIVRPTDVTDGSTAQDHAPISRAYSPMVITNCAMFGWNSYNYAADTNYSGNNNACSSGSTLPVGGTGNLTSVPFTTATFVNPSNASNTLDLRILTGSQLVDAGRTDAADIPSLTDIFGTSRPQGTSWDIGAHELTQASVRIYKSISFIIS